MKYVVYALLISVMVFVFLFPRRLDKELIAVPLWASDVNSISTTGTSHPELYPYRMGERFGFVSGDGDVVFSSEVLYGLTVSGRMFFNYSNVNQTLALRDSSGSIVQSFETRGYPFFVDERLFILATDRTSLSEWDIGGALLWTRDFGSILTSMDAVTGHTVVGLLDGRILLLDGAGRITYEYESEGSRISAVYGCSIDRDASRIAAVVGLGPQRFVLLEKRDGSFMKAADIALEGEERRAVYTRLSENGDRCLVIGSGGVLVYETVSRNASTIPFDGEIKTIDTDEGLIHIVSASEGELTYSSFATAEHRLAASPIRGVDCYLDAAQRRIFFGMDSTIARFEYRME